MRLAEAVRRVCRAPEPGKSGEDGLCSAAGLRDRLMRDAMNYFLSKIVPGLMGFLSVLVFVRMVGVEQYGRYAVLFALVMASASGLAGWLSQGTLRFQSQWREPAEAENFRRSVAAGTILSVAAGALALGGVIPALGLQRGWALLISLALFGAALVYTVALARFQASLRSAGVLRFEAARSAGGFLIPVALMWVARSKDYRLLLLGIALGYSLPLCVSMFGRAKAWIGPADFWRASLPAAQRKVLSGLWQFGWPVALWLLCQQSLAVSDRYFLQRFAGYSEAGVYASMYDVIVRSFSLLFMPITLAVHPLVMNRWNAGSRGDAIRAIRTGMKFQALLFVPIGLSLALLAPWVSRLVLGKHDARAAGIVLPLAVGGFLWQVCLLSHKPLEILCQTKRMLAGILVALAVNVGGNWLLVPRYGYRASAYLTVASSAAYLLSLVVLTPFEGLRRAVRPSETAARMENADERDKELVTTS
ncbi:MAG: lipopolysaccharide biosynthesis protein [Candidatus Acidiferrales bacterium]